jgi:hypothetical protein
VGYSRFNATPSKLASESQTVEVVRPSAPLSSMSLQGSVQEASSALVALVGRTADEAVEQSRLLLPGAITRAAAMDADGSPIETPVRSFREAGQGVSAGLEPVTASARRAVDFFLGEMPGKNAKPKMQN